MQKRVLPVNASASKSAVSRFVVPRKFVFAAARGLRRSFGLSAHSSPNASAALMEALRYANAFHRHCAARSAQTHAAHFQPNLSISSASSKATLASLMPPEAAESGVDDTFSIAARQLARMHATLQQWLLFTAMSAPREAFAAHQTRVSRVLLRPPPRLVSISSQPNDPLVSALHRRGVAAYVDLLVHHERTPIDRGEWDTVCAALSPNGTPDVRRLPLRGEAWTNTSWERALALLRWGLHFQSLQREEGAEAAHIPSVDIAYVLQHYAQHKGGVDAPTGAEKWEATHSHSNPAHTQSDPVMVWLQQQWTKARALEQRNRPLAIASHVDRTAASHVQISGRRVAPVVTPQTPNSDVLFAELLLHGKGSEVMRQLRRLAARTTTPPTAQKARTPPTNTTVSLRDASEVERGKKCQEKLQEKEEEDDILSMPHEANTPIAILDGPDAANDVFAAFFNRRRPLGVWVKLRAHPERLPSPLLSLFRRTTAAEGELELLRSPHTPRALRWGSHPEMISRSNRHPTDASHVDAGQSADHRHPALLELRHRVWALRRLPRHVPRSLVRFEGRGKGAIPRLRRSPARELLPWFLLTHVAAAGDSMGTSAAIALDGTESIEEAEGRFQRVRAQVFQTLFTHARDYAASHEYVMGLLVELGSLLAPASIVRTAVRVFLRPPPLGHFASSEETCHAMWTQTMNPSSTHKDSPHDIHAGCEAKLTEAFTAFGNDPNTWSRFMRCKSGSMRNYYVSIWFEALALMDHFDSFLHLLSEEIQSHGPPLLAPESAAAILTAVCVHVHASSRPKDEWLRVLEAMGPLHFVVPVDRAAGAMPYFKGMYMESCIHPFSGEALCDWEGDWNAADGLLAGRSLRLISKYPTTCTEAFLRISQHGGRVSVTHRTPPLRLRHMTLDLLEALRRLDASPRATANVVAHKLPFGVSAVCKAVGVSSTLHASLPHLVGAIRRAQPWGGEVGTTPVLHQGGLVNRIDVGTSGLLLIAHREEDLMAARHASVVGHRVEKTYRALLLHCPAPPSRVRLGEECWYLNPRGTLTQRVFADGADYALQRTHALEWSGVAASLDQRRATTMYRVLAYFPRSGVYDVEVQLRSGRRHQIRQHFAKLWHPLLGDSRYNARAGTAGAELGLQRPALHAFRITLTPTSGTTGEGKTVVECPLPDDMRDALRMLRDREERRR